MTESFFPISNYFMFEKNIENTQFLTLSVHTFPFLRRIHKYLTLTDLYHRVLNRIQFLKLILNWTVGIIWIHILIVTNFNG